MREQTQSLEVSEKQIEILARRLLPVIRRFFADESVRKEFEDRQREQQTKKAG